MDKQELRQFIAHQLDTLENRKQREQQIYDQLFGMPEWHAAQSVAITLSFRNECATEEIILKAWEHGKHVVIPKVVERQMRFFDYTRASRLVENKMGIREPDETAVERTLDTIDLCIVPGRVFMRNGFRIGWGGGFYDRALASYPGHTLSVAFEKQLVPIFDIEPFDQPVNQIVTESEVIRCR
ncbi:MULTISPECIES: 5-formyltetrahydrofolate cyclo-ligase [Exiguobacterium]|uniref:5-formyltetrahydrofolate cyclo-ligase n=1 Tax=Exiguobacterium antarcticum TaxID=132920 RepID=A0ABT6QZJ8_9BACL|nr:MULTISPECIES: 5-formyltetrahydrofolate cyclo-ligase [Exiguobacterium]AFS69981.1 5-formyltetrahydrofolate cyclo-ligase [Exiguobacterium antarcticum B7]MCT4781248.1 5-formyltetrahydrofolate cyclo-ligase [Exiguobacterium soli]MDI3234109.1 5-formyltetrahydrofolate cyclo-ligase [Exiguobacterium antarcticum]